MQYMPCFIAKVHLFLLFVVRKFKMLKENAISPAY